MLTTSTPAKIILSGEHSVIYGAPALGAPLGLYLHAHWEEQAGREDIVLNFRGQRAEIAPSWGVLSERLAVYRQRYADFQNGAAPIGSVLPSPQDLVALTLAAFSEKFDVKIPGLLVSLETEIPVSSGLGSSSALILTLLRGMLQLTGRAMPQAELLDFARGIEDFQHGASSGLDLALVSAHGPLVFVRGQGIIDTLPAFSSGLLLVHTGTPSVSTGACVAQVREGFGKDKDVWDSFAACTRRIQAALSGNDVQALKDGVAENAALLEKIGVVPERVKAFTDRCAARGIPAKVCGAGAVAGDAAGMVWAAAANDGEMQQVRGIAQEYGYSHGLHAIVG